MEKVFLSYSFRAEDRDLVAAVTTVLESFNLRVVTGSDLGGGAITPTVMSRIDECDGLVALATATDQRADGHFDTRLWIHQELSHARSRNLRNIAMIDSRVVRQGAYSENERIDYDTQNPLSAFLRLTQTIGIWKREAGRMVKVLIQPQQISRRLTDDDKCEYRLRAPNGRTSGWRDAIIVPEVAGKIAYLTGIPDDALIELRVRIAREVWTAPAQQPWMQIHLKKEGAR